MAVLYRKYRPQLFREVLGQKIIVQTLKNQAEKGAFSHAYLFTGSRGVGKTSVARILAKAANCTSESRKDGDACGKCKNCKFITQGNFIDLVEIDAASNTGVDNIRDLIEHVKFSPSMGKYKVFIIDEVHMLSKGAFNALLKTLEEPPQHAIFVLATTEINKVPATIVSRTQRFDFKRLEEQDLKKQIANILENEKLALDSEIISLIAQNAEGSSRDALSILDKVLTLGSNPGIEECRQLLGITDEAICIKLLEFIQSKQAGKLSEFFEELKEQGADFIILNKDFLEFLRKLLVAKVTEQNEIFEDVPKILKEISLNELVYIIKLFLRSYKELSTSPIVELPMLVAGLEIIFRNSENANVELVNKKISSLPIENLEPKKEIIKPVAKPESIEESSEEENLVSMEEVKKKWQELIDYIRKINSPLSNLVKNSVIQKISGTSIIITVDFLFHKESLNNSKSQEILNKALIQIFGKVLNIKAQVGIKEMPKKVESAEALGDALKIFGGELIE